MAEERQPTNIVEGASKPPAPTARIVEDHKASAALSSLDAQDDECEKRNFDSEALGEAMKTLSVDDNGAVEKKKAVKVDTADVTLLVC